MDRALYEDRSLVKHMAMRRTLFVFPREVLPVAQAGASSRVADVERRRLIRDVEKAGLHRDGERWLAGAEKEVLAALSDGREATSSELRAEIPSLEGVDHVRRGQVVGRAGAGRAARADDPFGRGANRAGVERRVVDHVSRPRWASTQSWLGEEIAPMPEAEGVAGLVERWLRAFGPGTEADIKWWLGLDDRRGAAGAGRPRGGRGRPRRADRLPASGRPGADRAGRAVGDAPAPARPDHDGLVRARVVPRPLQGRSCSTRAATPGRPRGGTGGSSAAGGRPTRARSSCSCSRTSARRGAPRSSARRRG